MTLTPVELDRAKSFLTDLFICAGIAKNSRTIEYCEGNSLLNSAGLKKVAVYLKNAIIKKDMYLEQIDRNLEEIVASDVYFGETPKSETLDWQPSDKAELAKYVAWFCQFKKLYWDDRAYTVSERKYLASSTIFGKCLYDAGCFVSQHMGGAAPEETGATSTASTASTVSSSTIKGKKPSIRDDGPQSKNCVGLLSKSGEKEYPKGCLYTIESSRTPSRIKPHIFIHPINNPTYRERARQKDGVPTLCYGTGQEWTDIQVYSPDKAIMDEIEATLIKKELHKRYPGLGVVKTYGDPAGYYRINSEFGELYIRTFKLNEEIQENVSEDLDEFGIEKSLYKDDYGMKVADWDQFVRDSKLYD